MRKKSFILVVLLLLLLFFPTIGVTENTSSNQEIDIATYPAKIFFDLRNLKPGDSISRNLQVSNNGINDFKYVLSNKFISGDRVFYNQLDLVIEDKKKMLYQGKLNKFEGLSSRMLESNQTEELYFYITIPMELGNEFQGLSSEFEIKISVEGTLGGVLPVDNKLPTTGSEMFNFLAVGGALLLAGLILFIYIKRKKLDTKRP